MPESDGNGKCDAVSLECHAWPSLAAMAQRLSALAHRNLFRTRGQHHRCERVLPLRLAGEGAIAPLPALGGHTGRRQIGLAESFTDLTAAGSFESRAVKRWIAQFASRLAASVHLVNKQIMAL